MHEIQTWLPAIAIPAATSQAAVPSSPLSITARSSRPRERS